MTNEFLWQNGRRVERFEVPTSVDPSASGLWLGDGLFETMLALKGRIFARKRHIARFQLATQKLHLDLHDFEDGLDAAERWLNGRNGRIRLTQTSDREIFVFAREHQISNRSVELILYPDPVDFPGALSGIKSISYGVNAMALRFAKSHGADDVIFTNRRGEVTESSLANVLVWDGSTWWTPALTSGCLAGVTRELLIEFFGVKEREINVEELVRSEGLVLSSSLRGVQPVSKFQEISYGLQGEVDRLRQDFANWRVQNLNP